MQVFTYYARLPIGGALGALKMVKNERDQRAVIAVWERSWRRYGWEPVVLGEADAVQADADWTRQFEVATHLYDSPNPRQYEMACYLRWVAMSARGGLMTDYDVLNLGFSPEDWTRLRARFAPSFPLSLAGGVPCCVGGTRAAFADMVRLFLQFEAHPVRDTPLLQSGVSDQNIFACSPARFCTPDPVTCVQYLQPDWEKAALVHVPHIQIATSRARALSAIMAEHAAPTAV